MSIYGDGAYALTRLTPNKLDNFSDKPTNRALAQIDKDNAAKAAQDANKLARAKASDKSTKDFKEEFGLSKEDFVNTYTGFNNYDDFANNVAGILRDRYVEQYRVGEEAARNGDYTAQRNAEERMRKVLNQFDVFKSNQESYKGTNEDYVTRALDGKISEIDAESWETDMENDD